MEALNCVQQKSAFMGCLVKIWSPGGHLMFEFVFAPLLSPPESPCELHMTDGLEWSMSGLCLFNLTEHLSSQVLLPGCAPCVELQRSRVEGWQQFMSRGESALRGKHAASLHTSRSGVLPRNEGRGRDRSRSASRVALMCFTTREDLSHKNRPPVH